MVKLAPDLVFIGFGEAAMAFAADLPGSMTGYDLRFDQTAKKAQFQHLGVRLMANNAGAVAGATLILSLVTADEALNAARQTAGSLTAGALYCDMNSVAPETKKAARELIEAGGGRYVDIAVMAPVLPARRSVPMLASGPHAEAACAALARFGFRPRAIAGDVGAASAVKMVRSVLVKGLEALTSECFIAAQAAGITDEVAASLSASWPGTDWAMKADYNLDRMLVHGLRRAAEMDEVVRTLDAIGTGSAMSRAAAQSQRAIGAIGMAPPVGFAAKAALVSDRKAIAA